MIADVLWSGLRERLRGPEMIAAWRRAFVAFVVMQTFVGVCFARPSREFGGPLEGAIFAMVVSVPYHLGALIGIIVPSSVVMKTAMRTCNRPAAWLAAAGFGALAFLGIVFAMAIIDRPEHISFTAYVLNVLRMRQGTPIMLAALIIGSAIVMSPRRGQSPHAPTARAA